MSRGPGILFFLAATAFNLAVTAALFFGALALWGLVLAPFLRLSSSAFVILPAFAAAVAGSALIYKAALKAYLRRRSGNPGGNPGDPLTKP